MSQYVGNGDGLSTAVAQAQGMVSVQVSCTMEEALTLMRSRARSTHQTLEYVAAAVVARDFRFD